MKYNININQKALAETDLDFADAAILDYLIVYCNSRNTKIVSKKDDNNMTWVSYSSIIRDLPMLRIKSKSVISKRINKLVDNGFIITEIKPDGKLFIDLTEKVDDLFIINDRSQKRTGAFSKKNGTVLKKERIIYTNNNNTNNNINNNNAVTSIISLFEQVDSVISMFERLDIKNKTYYGNKTQRQKAEFLLKHYGYDRVKQLIQVYLKCKGDKFLPSISSPYDMVEKWSKLEDYFLRKKADMENLQNSVV